MLLIVAGKRSLRASQPASEEIVAKFEIGDSRGCRLTTGLAVQPSGMQWALASQENVGVGLPICEISSQEPSRDTGGDDAKSILAQARNSVSVAM